MTIEEGHETTQDPQPLASTNVSAYIWTQNLL